MKNSQRRFFSLHWQQIKAGGWVVIARKVRSLAHTLFRIYTFVQFKIKQNLVAVFGPIYSMYKKRKTNTILYACYDLSVSNPTYDIIVFLYFSEIERIKKKCSNIHLLIITGNENEYSLGQPNSYDATSNFHGRINNIVIPCYQLLPSILSVSYFGSRNEGMLFLNQFACVTYPERYHVLASYSGKGLVDLFRMKDLNQYDIKLRAPAYAHAYVKSFIKQRSFDKRVVTITLRESSYEEKRNSLLLEWIRFAEEITEKGFLPVFIRDTEKSPDPSGSTFGNLLIFPEASVHIPIRMAVYEQAFLNLSVNGGPNAYCIYNNKIPYLLFKLVTGEGAASESWFRAQGIEPGTQPPICGQFQKWVWKDDTYDTILEEFIEMVEKMGMARSIH